MSKRATQCPQPRQPRPSHPIELGHERGATCARGRPAQRALGQGRVQGGSPESMISHDYVWVAVLVLALAFGLTALTYCRFLVRQHAAGDEVRFRRFVPGYFPVGEESYVVGFARDGLNAVSLIILVSALAGGHVVVRPDGRWDVRKEVQSSNALVARFIALAGVQPSNAAHLWSLAWSTAGAAEAQLAGLAEHGGLTRPSALGERARVHILVCAYLGLGLGIVAVIALAEVGKGWVLSACVVALAWQALMYSFMRCIRAGHPSWSGATYLRWLDSATEYLRPALSDGRAGKPADFAMAIAASGAAFLRDSQLVSGFREYLQDTREAKERVKNRDYRGDWDSERDSAD